MITATNSWKELLSVYLDLDFETYVTIVNSLMDINRDTLDDELEDHARIYSYYSGLYEFSKTDLEKECTSVAYRQGQIKQEITEAYTGKRLTALVMDTELESNEELVILQNDLTEKRYKLGLLKSIVSSFGAKKDMLVQLSANSRAEKNIYS